MDAYMNELVDLAKEEVPEAEGIVSVTSPGFGASSSVNSGFMFTILSDPAKRDRSQQQILQEVSPKVKDLTGARTFVSQEQSIGNRRSGLPVQFVVQAPNFEQLEKVLPRFLEAARRRTHL
jgi:multidrug efflux pump